MFINIKRKNRTFPSWCSSSRNPCSSFTLIQCLIRAPFGFWQKDEHLHSLQLFVQIASQTLFAFQMFFVNLNLLLFHLNPQLVNFINFDWPWKTLIISYFFHCIFKAFRTNNHSLALSLRCIQMIWANKPEINHIPPDLVVKTKILSSRNYRGAEFGISQDLQPYTVLCQSATK